MDVDDPTEVYSHYILKHSSIHDGYECCFPMCMQRFKRRSDFSVHIYNSHSFDESLVYICVTCKERFPHKAKLLTHLRDHVKNYQMTACPICDDFQTNVLGTWQSHQSRKHDACSKVRDEYTVEKATDQMAPVPLPVPPPQAAEPSTSDIATPAMEPSANNDDDFINMVAMMLLKLQVLRNVPGVAINDVIEDLNSLHLAERDQYLPKIKRSLESMSLPEETVDNILSVVSNETRSVFYDCTRPGGPLCSNYKRQKFYETELPYIKPVEYTLGKGPKQASFQYIPIIEELTQMLSKQDVLDEVLKSNTQTRKTNPKVYSSYQDGRYYQDIVKQAKVEIQVLIGMYVDDAEVCNPLGTSSGIHKITTIYWTLNNVPQHFRSKLAHIKLAILAKRVDVDAHGLSPILKPLFKDLKKLEDIGVYVESMQAHLACAIIFISADNLGAHFISNRYESFGPTINRFCRYCMITFAEWRTTPCKHPSAYTWRTVEGHNHQVKQIEQCPTAEHKQLYGIKGESVFSDKLDTFHVARGLPADPAHDLLEGIVPIEIALALAHFIDTKLFTFDEINSRVLNFKYLHHDKTNKPHEIRYTFKKNQCINGNAHENWCFLRMFPLIFGDRVPTNDKYFSIILLLKDIVEIVMAPVLDEDLVIYLDELIQEHKLLFIETTKVNPKVNPKPKLHFVDHYPELIRCFGPLVHCFTLRYEAKHQIIKQIAKVVCNFTNILKTFAVRNQLREALLMNSDFFLGDHTVDLFNEELFSISLMAQEAKELLEPLSEEGFVHKVTKVVINGMDYLPGLAIHIGHENAAIPLFGKIEMIVVHDSEVYFLTTEMETQYNADYHIYELIPSEPKSFLLVTPDDLVDYYPLALYPWKDHYAVTLKHFLTEVK